MSTDLSSGRANQKQRTRRALLDAAQYLLVGGEAPTIDEIAETALVSRATVYRYFPSVDALVAEALLEQPLKQPEELLNDIEDPLERVAQVVEHINDILFSNEVINHITVRSFATQWLDADPKDRPIRPGRRLPLINAALEPLGDKVDPDELQLLRDALALIVGIEAVVSLRDVCGLDVASARRTALWAANQLTKALTG